ncbi:nucleoside-diphosphate-sugar epimerase [Nocardioides luteus]|uniref:Reductase n=1 Tax=Nocardioides luteus TaxID=1844 RepID=A0ABQ5SWI9_9ACTN|nr:NAD-dependent epimerase/dehydratase family protein [Nocardioides luteus]MDR7311972.1 nucleoside-diphosphate-sugar epimerase [Nocardioides luteus]GGR68364.1 reductase [Nocardioides luteus]GLJ68216.1 reductase [Nocardioides luteus]
MQILVLGGTAWLGRTITATALELGHEVTCLARSASGAVPDGAGFVRADRDKPGAYDQVAEQRWDGVIDLTRQPGHARDATEALAGTTDRWVLVSTGNVYRSHARLDDDETAPTLDPLEADAMESSDDYGPAKVACEQAVLDVLGDRAVIARAGLIGGPGDESGRSGYWPWRFAHPADDSGSVLVPASEIQTSLIDVRDLAAWIVGAAAGEHATGVYDAVANRMSLPDYLKVAREVAGHEGPTVPVTDAWLLEQGVAEWMGPKSLPGWIADPDWRGFAAHQGARIAANGLAPRPLAETLRDVLAWEEARPEPGPHGAGLSDEEEQALLAAATAEVA